MLMNYFTQNIQEIILCNNDFKMLQQITLHPQQSNRIKTLYTYRAPEKETRHGE